MRIDPRTDAELVLAARAGDKQEFGQLVERHLTVARRVAVSIIANREIAWELAQEAVLQAYLALDTLRAPDRFQGWLYGIVRNICQSYLRSQKLSSFPLEAIANTLNEPQPLIGMALDPQKVVEEWELARRIQAAIESLSPKNQAATRLFYFEELSIQEIAVQLGASVPAIKGRLYQSRKQLQAQLAPVYGMGERRPPTTIATDERKPNMVKISAIHVIEVEATGHKILYLLDTAGHRFLPIWVGPYEGEQIAQYLRGAATSRPMTYHFMASLLDKLGAKLQEVRIEKLDDFTYCAVASVQGGGNTYEVDARPSDAVALALHMSSPVFIADDVLQKFGHDLPQAFDEQGWLQEETRRLAEGYYIAKAWETKLKEEPSLFTQDAKQVLQQAQALAFGLNHNYIGTEHLLLSLVNNQGSGAANVLSEFGIGPVQVADAVERLIGRGKSAPAEDPVLVPRVAHVLALATEEQLRTGHPQLGVEHLLLGILREGNGMAVTILRELGIDLEQVQAKLLEVVKLA